MNKLIYVLVLMLTHVSFAGTYNSSASVKIMMKTCLKKIKVSGVSRAYTVYKNAEMISSNEDIILDVKNMSVKPRIVSNLIPKKQYLDFENYPQVRVSELWCDRLTLKCDFLLKLKGQLKRLEGMLVDQGNNQFRVEFKMNITDFNIAQGEFLWKVEKDAMVHVDINIE